MKKRYFCNADKQILFTGIESVTVPGNPTGFYDSKYRMHTVNTLKIH